MVSDRVRRQQARVAASRRARQAYEAQQQLHVERKQRDARLSRLGIVVADALALAAEQERRAGSAIQTMTVDEAMTLADAARWCGDLNPREASRLRRLATNSMPGTPPGATDDAQNSSGH